jgi:hypothetical protein
MYNEMPFPSARQLQPTARLVWMAWPRTYQQRVVAQVALFGEL